MEQLDELAYQHCSLIPELIGGFQSPYMLAGLRGQLPDEIHLPPSVTIPFSSFEEALKQPDNKDLAKELEAAIKNIPTTNAEDKLSGVRELVMKVMFLPQSVA